MTPANAPPAAREVNFDGLVGLTHNYAGLSPGNLASQLNARAVSSPRAAALQGLAKMRTLAGLGLAQAVLPPHERPDLALLRALGFEGDDASIIGRAAAEDPALLAAAASASAMWTANAATVAPSADTADGRVHLTPANLVGNLHRAIEPPTTARVLRSIFTPGERFVVHDPLPATPFLGDEGAANHTRLAPSHGEPGVHLFVHGRSSAAADPSNQRAPRRHPARHTLEASRALARLHRLDPARVVFAQQTPTAIDAGVFHNDVIAVGNGMCLVLHENAYVNQADAIARVRLALDELGSGAGDELSVATVRADEVPLDEAVRTYLFNSQLLSLPPSDPDAGGMLLLMPVECAESSSVAAAVERLVADENNPIARAEAIDVRESMRNGGGPACLRLRVVLTDDELAAMNRGVLLTDELANRLEDWITRRYRDELSPADLADPALLTECRDALDELTGILHLGDVYPFQIGSPAGG